MANLVLQLFGIFAPLITSLIQKYQDAHDGKMPTDDELKAEFEANIDGYLAEIDEWKASHPSVE